MLAGLFTWIGIDWRRRETVDHRRGRDDKNRKGDVLVRRVDVLVRNVDVDYVTMLAASCEKLFKKAGNGRGVLNGTARALIAA